MKTNDRTRKDTPIKIIIKSIPYSYFVFLIIIALNAADILNVNRIKDSMANIFQKPAEKAILGSWDIGSGTVITFKKDGKLLYEWGNNPSIYFNWNIISKDKNKLTMMVMNKKVEIELEKGMKTAMFLEYVDNNNPDAGVRGPHRIYKIKD